MRSLSPIRLLIVDDSALMRRHLARLFEAEGDFEVMTCPDGASALQAVPRFRPDVLSLDVTMPGLDGLSVLARLMVEHPLPVVMVSTLTGHGTLATLEALAMGAVDCIAKPRLAPLTDDAEAALAAANIEIVEKIRAAARATMRPAPVVVAPRGPARPPVMEKGEAGPLPGLVLIGVSTGGPRTLERILPLLPADFPWPVVVCQHMPAAFTGAFAARLDKLCPLRVREVAAPTPLAPGIHVARGDADLVLAQRGDTIVAMPRPTQPDYHWHPAIDGMVRSAMNCLPPQRLIGVLLTGMGDDGATAMRQLRSQGGRTVAESAESAVVFGMPQALIAADGASVVLAADQIAHQLQQWACAPIVQ
ncbi:chemotaxis-specific protein-glutamate methyltransferase CheB [Chitiniphilus eburneus]|uniref:Protein-glutamate methylesterase/protein-glutamine glutaminase n=1 Tax=Chitiniphilus eburneus TaxID=2571148 RepID=A0A4U0QBI5_9NEIS|nr:chemotaxis-specific protein-glutamate methyltransferase CheB [Chitiniphilus eburneus]TJZ78753.1 chemotaxis-specific protein-glutamate methyltransferase CheB [Chitiniphilus eburneus]